MEIVRNILSYVVKNLYYSSLLVLPLLLILGFFKKINTEYKYKISLVVLLLRPLLPFISIPKSFNSVVTETRIEKVYSGLLDRPLAAISNIEPIYIEESISALHPETSTLVIDSNSAVVPLVSRSLDFKLLVLQALCLIYLSVVFVLIVRLINSVLSLRKKIKYSVFVTDPNITGILEEVISILNIKKKIHIVLVKKVSTPFSVGVFNNYIVLPLEHTYNKHELKQILLHEATHILRRDCLITLFQRVIEIVLFFNPAIWLISSSLTKNRELICDAQVVKSYNDRESYAKVLLDTAMLSVGIVPQFCNGTVGSKKELSKRIDLIVNQKTEYKKVFKRVIQLTLVLLCFSSTLLIGCSNSRSIVKKLNDNVTQIIDKIDNDNLRIYYWDRDKKEQMTQEIELVEKSLRTVKNRSNNRNLAYLLMKKSEVLTRSYLDDDTAKYLTGDESLALSDESLKLIDEYGNAGDKGTLYLTASHIRIFPWAPSYIMKAIAFFKEAGDIEQMVKTSLVVINRKIYIGIPHIYDKGEIREELIKLYKLTKWNKQYQLNTYIQSMLKLLSHKDQFWANLTDFSYSGMTLKLFDNGRIKIDDNLTIGIGFPKTYIIPDPNSTMLNPFSIISSITGSLAFPDNQNLLQEDMTLNADKGLYPGLEFDTVLTKIEEFETLNTPESQFNNGVKVTYKVTETVSDFMKNESFNLPFKGIHEVWYVKGIGIVQYKNIQEMLSYIFLII